MTQESPQYLYKFCSPQAGLAILESRSLRWSAPDCFSDPFEMTRNSRLNFDSSSLLESTTKLASSMIFAPESPKGDSPLINAIKRWRDEGRFEHPEEAHGVLKELLGKMVDYRLEQLNASLAKWQRFVRNVRVCCFSSKLEDLGTWSHFACAHRGMAMKFASAETSSLAGAKPVVYQNERPELSSLREQLGAILHNRKDAMIDRFQDHLFVKAKAFKDENEWRIARSSQNEIPVDDENVQSWYEDISFASDELAAVYFGLLTPTELKKACTEIIQSALPHTKIFQAVRAKSGFQIEFERINKNS